MKKFIGILVVLTMALVLLSSVSAFATAPTGSFNVPDNATAVAKETLITYKFTNPVDPEEQENITADLHYRNADTAGKTGSTLTNTTSNYGVDWEWSADGQYLTIYRAKEDHGTRYDGWFGGTSTNSAGNLTVTGGRSWKVTLMYNGTKFDDLLFTVPATKVLNAAQWSAKTSLVEGEMVDNYADRTRFIQFEFNVNTFASRGEKYGVVIKKNGVAVDEYTGAWQGNTFLKYRVSPTKAWDAKSKYEINLSITAPCYDKDGNIASYNSILSGGEKTFTFYTEGYVEPVAEEYSVEVTNDGNDYTVNVTSNVNKEATLIMVSKDSSTGLIGAIRVVTPFNLTANTPISESFTINDGEVFDYFLWEKDSPAPLCKK